MPESLSLGVDLGGTKIEAAVLRRVGGVDGGFDVLARERVATPAAEGYDAVLAATAALADAVAHGAGLSSSVLPVGVGMPGAVTRQTGLVKNSNTLCLNGRPFRADLENALGRRIEFQNDANCFALAEAQLGAGRAYREGLVFGAILGTGVGGGIVFGGRVWDGPQNLGGEWGHHAVGPWVSGRAPEQGGAAGGNEELEPGRSLGMGLSARPRCYCGNTGCLELYLSGKAVERDYRRRGGESLALPAIVQRRGFDAHAAAALDEMLEAFGRAVANLVDVLDPSALVIGGGVSNLDMLYDEGRERVRKYVFNDELLTPILRHELGDSAGVLGAALLPGAVDQRR